ncbi:MAG: excinuclease ABC subunit C [Bacteroidetes bacterium]|nr:excinuclease ABC subunit C [Bacteroidota bacterium]MBS1632331.1 excinuclease ABC subunit C [Bacteroidota bacterium]
MTQEEYHHIAKSIPGQPGIYKYFDVHNELLYVGKAKNLRKRVNSYFIKTFGNFKTHELVRRIARIEFTIVDSEQDAFLLENSLIKQFQPRFNINLKDDKSYPYIVIKNEPFPRIFLTRRVLKDGSEYLGPFTSVKKVKELLDFIKYAIPLRNCTLNLTDRNIQKKKFKVCLEFHLGNCKGPCEGLQTSADYAENLTLVKNILRGNLSPVIRYFKKEMKSLSEDLKFEKAEILRKKIEFLKNYQSRSIITGVQKTDVDVFSIVKEKTTAYVNYLMVRNGTIIQTHTSKMEIHLDEKEVEILSFAIPRIRETFNSDAKEVVIPFSVSYPDEEIIITIPKGGHKKKLLELSEKNVNYFIDELKNKERLRLDTPKIKTGFLLKQLQDTLKLPAIPSHIECFDNSNFQGGSPVSAMVCFKNGEPSKSDYRHFNVKTVTGINDFATMKEAVYRRYKSVLEENMPFPQLVIIDGGKGQLNAAIEAFKELNASSKTTLIGLAKNEEEIFFAGDKESLKLPFDNESLRLVRRIRDEVHRFGIGFHRKKRSEHTFKNELEAIPGVGKNTADLLLKEFRSVKNIKVKSLEELGKTVGKSKGKIVYEYFKNNT